MKKISRLSFYWKFVIAESIIVVLCGLLFRVTAVSDYYVEHIFFLVSHTYSRLTGLVPFSVGEILLVLAAVLLFFEVSGVFFLMIFRKKTKISVLIKRYSKGILVLALFVVWLMTMNCSALFHTSKLNVHGNREKTYSTEQICILRDYMVQRCNALSEKMERDEDGNVKTSGDVNAKVKAAMTKLSEKYPRLRGYYPDPKPIAGSYMMFQAGCDGVYFPFTMEANYNQYISQIRYPHVVCHELAHLKGYIYEDEADFMAYLACTGSDDEQLQYAGYLGVLWYVEDDFEKSRPDKDAGQTEDFTINERVYSDSNSYTKEVYDSLKKRKALIPTGTVETASDNFTDTYMTYYDATPNYDEVTKLLLAYYDGILY